MASEDRNFAELYEQLFAHLAGEGERPDLAGVPAQVVAELEALEAVAAYTRDVDLEMIPAFDEDPVALRLGFRSGPAERRLSGSAIARARRTAQLSVAELAARATTSDAAVSPLEIEQWERAPWTTVLADVAAALASALGVDESDLRSRPESMLEQLTRMVSSLGLSIEVAPDPDLAELISERIQTVVLSYLDLRVRAVVLDDVHDAERLRDADVLRVAQLVLRMSGETSAVALVVGNEELTTQIVEPADVADAVAAPTGRVLRFVPARMPLPFELAIREFFERVVPRWDALEDVSPVLEPVDWPEAALPAAQAAIHSLQSKRILIEEKRRGYDSLDGEGRDPASIVEVVRAVAGGISADALTELLDEKAANAS